MRKTCSRCRKSKLFSEFNRDRWKGDGYQGYCKECNKEKMKHYQRRYMASPEKKKRWYRQLRRSQLKREYGVTEGQVNRLRIAQGGLCAVCRSADPLVIDHCHTTGQVRGLLCNRCNHALGHAKDDPAILRALARYLEDPVAVRVGIKSDRRLGEQEALQMEHF